MSKPLTYRPARRACTTTATTQRPPHETRDNPSSPPPAKAATLGKFKLRLAHLQALDELGATEQWLDGIPRRRSHFAGEARVTDVGDLRDIGEAERWTLLASLIHECRTTARDEIATMFSKRMAVIHKKGKERLAELHEAHRAESERLLDVFGDVLVGAREASSLAKPECQ